MREIIENLRSMPDTFAVGFFFLSFQATSNLLALVLVIISIGCFFFATISNKRDVLEGFLVVTAGLSATYILNTVQFLMSGETAEAIIKSLAMLVILCQGTTTLAIMIYIVNEVDNKSTE